MSQPVSSPNSFTDLVSALHTPAATKPQGGNVVRNLQVPRMELTPLRSGTDRPKEPQVIVHRDGDVITGIEFQCPCGCSKTVSFSYEGE